MKNAGGTPAFPNRLMPPSRVPILVESVSATTPPKVQRLSSSPSPEQRPPPRVQRLSSSPSPGPIPRVTAKVGHHSSSPATSDPGAPQWSRHHVQGQSVKVPVEVVPVKAGGPVCKPSLSVPVDQPPPENCAAELARLQSELLQERRAYKELQAEHAADAVMHETSESRLSRAHTELQSQCNEQGACIVKLKADLSDVMMLMQRTPPPNASNDAATSRSSVGSTTPYAMEEQILRPQNYDEVIQNSVPNRSNYLPFRAMPIIENPHMPPFNREACGSNVTLSEDGYTATRVHGFRQSAILSNVPLDRQAQGRYFEVRICKVVDGWVGGLGIGVTHTHPRELQCMPDRVWEIPNTYMAGYWGCFFLNGTERGTRWRADELCVGQLVGFLITASDIFVFVDERLVIHVDGATLHNAGLRDAPLYPVVDVFAATLSVTLVSHPSPPSCSDLSALSPLGSPR